MDNMREDFEAWYNQEYGLCFEVFWSDEMGYYTTTEQEYLETMDHMNECYDVWIGAYRVVESPESLALRRVIVLLGILALFFAARHFPKVKEGVIWALSFLPF